MVQEEEGDIVVEAQPYFDAERFLTLRLAAVVKIQSHVRAFFARRKARELQDEIYNKKEKLINKGELLGLREGHASVCSPCPSPYPLRRGKAAEGRRGDPAQRD